MDCFTRCETSLLSFPMGSFHVLLQAQNLYLLPLKLIFRCERGTSGYVRSTLAKGNWMQMTRTV